MKAIIMMGLPASGKSTYAKSVGYTVISKDIIREDFPNIAEHEVRRKEKEQINKSGAWGENIIIDNTHLNPRALAGVTRQCEVLGYEIEVMDMYKYGKNLKYWKSLIEYHDVCRTRNNARNKNVPNSVVDKMFLQKYGVQFREWQNNKVVMFDIDGTLADGEHRLHHLEGEKKNRPAYFSELGNDKPIEAVVEMTRMFNAMNYQVIIMSGRPDTYCKETQQWLRDNDIAFDHLLMRSNRDKRQDYDVKKELYEQCLKKDKDKIIGVFDDRPSVVKMRVEEGVFVFGCQQGYREF